MNFMRRIDVKYVLNNSLLSKISDYIFDNFYIVKDQKNEMFLKYYSLYFDTDDMKRHKDHINKKSHRQKIRIREYESHDKFIEIKDKNDHITNKIRIPVTSYKIDGEKQWISDNLIYDTNTLKRKLEVTFYRMTFISFDNKIRMTIDSYIRFYNYITNKEKNINDIVIEIKKNNEEKTDIENKLNEIGIQESGFSKYNIGLQLTS